MRQFFCCLAWFFGSWLIIVMYWLCLEIGSILVGPQQAVANCQRFLDSLNKLALCCSGKG